MRQLLRVPRIYSLCSNYGSFYGARALESVIRTPCSVQKRGLEQLAAIKQLRKVTNGGVAECKEALTKRNWEIDAAIAYIRQKQQNSHHGIDAQKPIFGKVAVPSSLIENKRSLIIELNCNCDFITSSQEFISLSQNIRNALQRAVDSEQIAIEDNEATSSITSLNLDLCNEAIFDDNEGISVGQMLKRLSGEYKRTIALSNVFLYRKASNVDYPGIYVHKRVNNTDSIIGTRFGLVNLRCEPHSSIPNDTVRQHIRDIAKALAIQLVANPPRQEGVSTAQTVDEGNSLMKQLLEQVWLQLDPVSSSVYSVCDAMGKSRPNIGPATTVSQTLSCLGHLLGSDKVYVEDALYMNSGENVVKFGSH